MHKSNMFSPRIEPLPEAEYRRGRLLSALLLLTLLTLVGCKSGSADVQFISRGKDLIAKKDYARALLEFKNASRLQPKNAEPYYQSGLAYLAMGDFPSAYRSLLQATELDPKHAGAQNKLSELIGSSISDTRDPQRLQEAEKRVQSVLAMVPGSSEALGTLGRTEYLLGKTEDAVKNLQSAIETSPQNLQAAQSLAMIKLRQKDFKAAEQILKKAATDSPKSAEAQLALARFYLVAQRAGDAEVALRQALNIDPKYGPAWLDLARLQYGSGRKEETEKTLSTLSALPDKQYRPVHAIYLFEQSRQDEAIKEFERQVTDDPNDRDAFTRLTSAYFLTKRFPDAERMVNAALKKNPKDTHALLERSKLYLITAKFSEAESDLNQVVQFDPNSGTAHYLLSKVFVARGQPLAARDQLGKALDFDPNLLAARLELAQALTIQEAGGKAALDLLDSAPENQKNLLPVNVARNAALFANGDREELRKSLVAGLTAFHRPPDLVLQEGLLKFQDHDMAGARKSLEEVLASRPEDTTALDTLGRTFVLQKQPDLGLRTIEEYVSRRPNSPLMQTLLGNWLAHSNHRDAARKAYAAALAADPTFNSARMSSGLLDLADGKLDTARQTLESLSRTPMMQAEAETALGMLEAKAGNPAVAILHYRKAVDANPKSVIALNNLAYLLANNTDQVDEALKYAQQAKELDANSVSIEDTIGWAFYRKGLYDTAVVHLRNAAAKQSSAVNKYHLAMAYLKAGDRQSGRRTLDEATRMDPNLPEAAAASRLMASLGGAK